MFRWVVLLVGLLWAGDSQAQLASQCITTALAGGTGDAITIPRLPCVPTTTLLILKFSATNTTTTPTLQPVGSIVQTIIRSDGTAVAAGDLKSGATNLLTNNGTNWLLFVGGGGGGGGGIAGPGLTVVNEIATWANTAGTQLKQGIPANVTANMTAGLQGPTNAVVCPNGDCKDSISLLQAMTQPTYSAHQIDAWAFCGPGCGGVATLEAVTGVGVLTPGSRANSFGLVNGIGGHVMSSDSFPGGGFPTSVALFGSGIADVNGSGVWGVNTLVSDNRGQAVSSGTGKWLYNEFDFNATSPNTNVFGLVIQGASLSQPASSNAFVVGPLSIGEYQASPPNYSKQWGSGLQVDDNVTALALNIGIGGPTKSAGAGSQEFMFGYVDPGGAVQHALMQFLPVAQAGGGNAALYVFNANPSIVTDIGVANGGFFQMDSAYTNAMIIGAHVASGANVASNNLLWHYFDGSGVSQNYATNVDNNGILHFQSTTGLAARYNFDGSIMVDYNSGVTCNGPPTAAFKVVGGIVTHC